MDRFGGIYVRKAYNRLGYYVGEMSSRIFLIWENECILFFGEIKNAVFGTKKVS